MPCRYISAVGAARKVFHALIAMADVIFILSLSVLCLIQIRRVFDETLGG